MKLEFKIIYAVLSEKTYFPLTLQALSQRCNIANMLLPYGYFHSKYTDEVYSLVPSVQTFTPRTWHATPT